MIKITTNDKTPLIGLSIFIIILTGTFSDKISSFLMNYTYNVVYISNTTIVSVGFPVVCIIGFISLLTVSITNYFYNKTISKKEVLSNKKLFIFCDLFLILLMFMLMQLFVTPRVFEPVRYLYSTKLIKTLPSPFVMNLLISIFLILLVAPSLIRVSNIYLNKLFIYLRKRKA